LGSMQILSWIISAYSVTGDVFYVNAYKNLTNNYGYHINIINAKITVPTDDNFSDDELLYLPYLTYLIAMKHMGGKTIQPDLYPYFVSSIERSQLSMNYRPASWNFIYYMFRNGKVDESLVGGSVQTLQEWNMEPIDWANDNSQRLDVYFNRELNRDNGVDTLQLLPYSERNHLRWNSDPFYNSPDLRGGGGATDPGAFVFAYWGCNWAGLGSGQESAFMMDEVHVLPQ